MFWFELFFLLPRLSSQLPPFPCRARHTNLPGRAQSDNNWRGRKTQTRQKGKKLSEGPETRPGWKQCSGNSEAAQMQTQRRCSDNILFKSYIILPNKVVKEVEKAGEEKNFSWMETVRSIADRRLVSVLGITVMVMIISRGIWSMSAQFYRKCQGAPLWNITGDRLPGGHLLLLSRIAAPLASSFFLRRCLFLQLTLVYSFDHVCVCVCHLFFSGR